MKQLIELTIKQARRLVIALIGGTIVLLGVIMLFTPGPGLVVIPVGLAILATEFVWAHRLLAKVREQIRLKTRGRESDQRDGGDQPDDGQPSDEKAGKDLTPRVKDSKPKPKAPTN